MASSSSKLWSHCRLTNRNRPMSTTAKPQTPSLSKGQHQEWEYRMWYCTGWLHCFYWISFVAHGKSQTSVQYLDFFPSTHSSLIFLAFNFVLISAWRTGAEIEVRGKGVHCLTAVTATHWPSTTVIRAELMAELLPSEREAWRNYQPRITAVRCLR